VKGKKVFNDFQKMLGQLYRKVDRKNHIDALVLILEINMTAQYFDNIKILISE